MLAGTVQAINSGKVNLNPNPSASLSVWVKIIINFHRPKLQCQSGFGICIEFQVGTDKATGSTGYAAALCPAQARISAGGQIELKVTEEDLLNYENGFALPYFKKGSITLEDPYTFSDAVTRQLGATRQLTIKPGSYPVVYDASALTYTVALTY